MLELVDFLTAIKEQYVNKQKIILNLIGILAFFSCQITAVYANEPQNLSIFKKTLIQYHDSGSYRQDQTRVTEQAMRYLEQRLQNNHSSQPLAIVLDIDETSLSNYPDMVKMNFGGTFEAMNQAICNGVDPAIQPTLALYQFAKTHHIAVFFVTARTEDCRSATIRNLTQTGFKDWDGLILRPLDDHRISSSFFKTNARVEIEKHGYDIVLNMGDQQCDLVGGHADKTFKLPNPYYLLP